MLNRIKERTSERPKDSFGDTTGNDENFNSWSHNYFFTIHL
jgi:hypothetical protein